LKPVRDGPLHWETAVADFLETFENGQLLDNFDNDESIQRRWVEMILKKCASEIPETRKKATWGNMQPAKDLGKRAGTQARSNLPELPNTTFMVVIRWLLNGEDMVLAPK